MLSLLLLCGLEGVSQASVRLAASNHVLRVYPSAPGHFQCMKVLGHSGDYPNGGIVTKLTHTRKFHPVNTHIHTLKVRPKEACVGKLQL